MNEADLVPAGYPDKMSLYEALREAAGTLMIRGGDVVANAANLAALLYHGLPDLNWLGFYFYKHGELVVGPFQGKPACVLIPMGKGVCGTAAERRETIMVADVHNFPGHIACDGASRSEIVVPLVRGAELLGVLDADSPVAGRFDDEDRRGLESLAEIWINSL